MKPLLKVQDAALYVDLAVSTMNKMRCTGDGPAFIRLGKRRVAYRVEDLDAWLHQRTHNSTSEYA